MKYCHECSYFTLKYYLDLKGHAPTILSDKQNEWFVINANSVDYVISVKYLTVAFNDHIEYCKDLSIFIEYIIEKIYGSEE